MTYQQNGNILVTGCSGFIGSHLSSELIRRNYTVIGIDNLNDVLYSSELKISRLLKLKKLSNFEFFEDDLLNFDFSKITKNLDYVINLAALPGQSLSWSKFDTYIDYNIKTTHKLLQFSIDKNIKKFVQASTSSVYGSLAVGDENTPTNPVSPYGISKLASEKLIYTFNKYFNIDYIILRYFSVYGPSQRPDMAISKFIESMKKNEKIFIHGNGDQVRDFTYVDDIVNATISAIESGCKNEIFNVSGGSQSSLINLVKMLQKLLESNSELIFTDRPIGDQDKTSADISKAQNLLNYYPKFNLDQGLRKQIQEALFEKTS